MTALDVLAYRAKAIVGAALVALVGAAEVFVNDPSNATAVESVIPAPYTQFVPIALLAIGTLLGYLAVYFKKNTTTATDTSAVAVEEPDTSTTMLTVPNSGEFTGAGAQ